MGVVFPEEESTLNPVNTFVEESTFVLAVLLDCKQFGGLVASACTSSKTQQLISLLLWLDAKGAIGVQRVQGCTHRATRRLQVDRILKVSCSSATC